MYNPCFECLNRYGRQYTDECDEMCEYANALSKLNAYGGLKEVIKVMEGDAFPLVLIDAEHIDITYRLVCAAKDNMI